MLKFYKNAEIAEILIAKVLQNSFFSEKNILIKNEHNKPLISVQYGPKMEFLLVEPECDFNINYVEDKKFDKTNCSYNKTYIKSHREMVQDNLGNPFTISKNNLDSINYLKNKYENYLNCLLENNERKSISLAIISKAVLPDSNCEDFEKQQYLELINNFKNAFENIYILYKDEDLKLLTINNRIEKIKIVDEENFESIYNSILKRVNTPEIN